MKLNWKQVEETLHELVSAEVLQIAKKHRNECFYAFAFDCNSDYGDLLISLNTTSGLKERVADAMNPADPQTIAWAKFAAEHRERLRKLLESKGKTFPPGFETAPKTEADYERDYRWSMGDWKFMDAQTRKFEANWKPFRQAIASAAVEHSSVVARNFMEMACRVMIRLEQGDQLARLPRTADFKTLVCNHDEDLNDAERRLTRIRRLFAQK